MKLPHFVLIKIGHVIAAPLSKIFNNSFRAGECPAAFKIAHIIPIFKKGDKKNLSNYRPISLISALAKVYEKCIHVRILKFLEQTEYLSGSQYGFRKGKSTTDALEQVTSHIRETIDSSKKCLTIFLDLMKAFDTLNHKLLLEKLHRMGIRGTVLKLIKSYLLGRKQRVKYKGTLSQEEEVTCGVPQGTVLGPLLWIIFIDDLLRIESTSRMICFADDTSITYVGNTWEEVLNLIKSDMPKILNWFTENGLSVNFEKTEAMTFGCYIDSIPTLREIVVQPATENHEEIKIAVVEEVKYLGLIFDRHLKWDKHIKTTLNKTRHLTRSFFKLRNFLTFKQLKIVYDALCLSVLSYGLEIWGGTFEAHFKHLEVFNNSVIKIMHRKPRDYNSAALYSETKILDIKKVYIKKLMRLVLKGRFLRYQDTAADKRLRYRYQVITPKKNTALAKTCQRYIGPRIINILPVEVREKIFYDTSLTSYKYICHWLECNGKAGHEIILQSKTR